MEIAITGSSGFIGKELTAHLLKAGHHILLMQRSGPKELAENTAYFPFDLKTPQTPDKKLDVLIHCAVATQSPENTDAHEQNVNATIKLRDYCRNNGVHFIFISTMSAHEDAISIYGKHKFELEQQIAGDNETVLRLGLVLGSTGGLFNNIRQTIEKGAVIPLVSGGGQPIQTIAIYDLCNLIQKVIDEKITGTYTVADPGVHTLKELYTSVAKTLGKNPKFLSLPYFFFDGALRVAEMMRVKLPVGRENLLGLKQLRSFDTEADLAKLKVKLDGMETAVNRIISGNV